jgi:protein O-mannosyl-transferase
MQSNNNSRFYISCVALLLGIIITYSNHFNNSFHFDDAHTIENNIFIRDLKNIPKFFTDATTFSSVPANQSYRPVVSATLAVGYWLSGDGSPFFFHLQNFWGFLLYTLLFYFFALKIFDSANPSAQNRYLALFCAALFSLHPLAAETVNYIISRSDIISSVGVMAGLVIWLYFPQKRKSGFYLLPVIIGMLAKPTAAMFAPILFFTDYLLNRDATGGKTIVQSRENSGFRFAQQIRKSIINSIPAFLVCGVMYLFIDYMTPKTWVAGGSSLKDYLITQPYVILLYFRNAIVPTHLSADTDLSAFTSLAEPKVMVGFVFLLLILFIIVMRMRNKNHIPAAIGYLWFLAALVPPSVVPLAEVMNDHRMFFPLPGLIMALVWTIHVKYETALRQAGKVVTVFCILLLSAFAYGTHQRNIVWHTEETLWKDVTEKSPRNGRGLMNYGLTQMAKGKTIEALDYFERAK